MIESSQKMDGAELPKKASEQNVGEVPQFKNPEVADNGELTESIDKTTVDEVPKFEKADDGISKDQPENHAEDPKNLKEKENLDANEIDELKDQYVEDLLEYSDCPETIDVDKFREAELEKVEPDENGKRREEFNEKKEDLIKAWEEKNGREWPRYDEDVYSDNGKLIRKKGQRYDAHHVQPLGMGGENTADNITPLHAQDHYDKQGIHAPDSAYSKLEQKLEQKG